MAKKTPYDVLMTVCKAACHDRNACTQGYRDLLAADSVSSVSAVWRKYLPELVSNKYADLWKNPLAVYAELKQEFNAAGIYFNESPAQHAANPLVIICDSDEPVHVYANAEVYIVGKAHVIAHDHAKVVCQQEHGSVELLDYSVGQITAGSVIARNRSTLAASVDCECYDSASVTISRGTLTDHGHASITAMGDAVVHSFTSRKITLMGNAKLNIR